MKTIPFSTDIITHIPTVSEIDLLTTARKSFFDKFINPETNKELFQQVFTIHLERCKTEQVKNTEEIKRINRKNLAGLTKDMLIAILYEYQYIAGSWDYAVSNMVRDGLIEYTVKKAGKAYGKVKGMELSTSLIPVLIKYKFGSIEAEIETTYSNWSKYRSDKEEKVYRAIANSINHLTPIT